MKRLSAMHAMTVNHRWRSAKTTLIPTLGVLAAVLCVGASTAHAASHGCDRYDVISEWSEPVTFAYVGLDAQWGVFGVGHEQGWSNQSTVAIKIDVMEKEGGASWESSDSKTIYVNAASNWSPVDLLADWPQYHSLPLDSFAWARGSAHYTAAYKDHIWEYKTSIRFQHRKYKCSRKWCQPYVGCPGGSRPAVKHDEVVALHAEGGTLPPQVWYNWDPGFSDCDPLAPGTDYHITSGELVNDTTTVTTSLGIVSIPFSSSITTNAQTTLSFGNLWGQNEPGNQNLFICVQNGQVGQASASGVYMLSDRDRS